MGLPRPILLATVLSAMLISPACDGSSRAAAASSAENKVHTLDAAPGGPERREFRERGKRYNIEIQYPYLAGADAFNAAVHRIVASKSNAFRKAIGPALELPVPPYDGYLTGKYTATISHDGVVSVLLNFSEYTPGAAHPWGLIESVNYDRRRRRLLQLSDLFHPSSDFIRRLSELAIASLEKQEYAVDSQIRHGAGPVAKNFKVFTLTNSALVLHFAQYQVAPGAAGEQHVEIPLATLASLMRPRWRPHAAPGL